MPTIVSGEAKPSASGARQEQSPKSRVQLLRWDGPGELERRPCGGDRGHSARANDRTGVFAPLSLSRSPSLLTFNYLVVCLQNLQDRDFSDLWRELSSDRGGWKHVKAPATDWSCNRGW